MGWHAYLAAGMTDAVCFEEAFNGWWMVVMGVA